MQRDRAGSRQLLLQYAVVGFHVASAIQLGDYNVRKEGQIFTLPLYMAVFCQPLEERLTSRSF